MILTRHDDLEAGVLLAEQILCRHDNIVKIEE
jgi:hypothetical protein